ncbi:hypothetical protein IQ268_05490 [Oculatella sp. LEGE 06141]|uniref:hypothetical protein n=1 Tax=Oculatella sp. LEGE 06141 TaxID=1828648 RepID=UPI0018812F05|nr:hypothetical protein [Oculatella sp. LEGE 06141]MBE9178037.1 hypothetical protein [Oculatella sp. LEGE 06141]
MNLFSQTKPKIDPAKVQEIKALIYQRFNLSPEVHVSISQSSCTEANCPPIETAIVIMSHPARTYKIQKPVAEIESADISRLLLAKL